MALVASRASHSSSAVWSIPLTASVLGVLGSLARRHRIPEHIARSA